MTELKSAAQLTIGALAGHTGLNVSAIRYYEEVGLIPTAKRRPSGHRVYDSNVQDVLTLIHHCRDFGFSIEETRALVSLSSNESRDCVEARQIAQTHLDAIRAKLSVLNKLERHMAKFVQSCSDQCAGGPAPNCTILKDLNRGTSKQTAQAGCCA